MNIGFIELIKFAKTDVDSYVRRGKNGPVKVKKHRRKYVEAAGTLLGGGAIVGAALLMVRRKHTIKKTGKFDSNNPTEWLEKQAKANADEANSVVEVLSKGRPNVQKSEVIPDIRKSKVTPDILRPKREPDIWDEPLAPFSTLADRPKSQQRQPLLLPPAKDNLTRAIESLPKPKSSKAGVYNDDIFPITPGAYFHGSSSRLSKISSIDETSSEGLYYGKGLYSTSSFEVAQGYTSKSKDAVVYQLIHTSPTLDAVLLDFDDDISGQLEKFLETFPKSAATKKLIKEYGTLNKLSTIKKRQKGERVADTETGFEKIFRTLYQEIRDNEFISDNLAREQMAFLKPYLNNRRAVMEFSDYLRKNTKYRGLKGKQQVNPGEGEYKVYWYPEQDLRVERVM